MRLLRCAIITFEGTTSPPKLIGASDSDCGIRQMGYLELPTVHGHHCSAVAEVQLTEFPDTDADGRVVVPDIPRKRLEYVLELSASLMAVLSVCSKKVSSPVPWVAFLPETAEERQWLASSNGLDTRCEPLVGPMLRIDPTDPKLQLAVSSRPDGVLLLAEALSYDSPVSKLRGLVRFFERAFGASSGVLAQILSSYLSQSELGFDESEVRRCVVSLRDETTHADRKGPVRLDSDVRHVVGRLVEAAYDVILNKEHWHRRDTQRGNSWRPMDHTGGPGGRRLVVKQGSTGGVTSEFLDGFGVWPVSRQARMAAPTDWWCPFNDRELRSKPFEIEVQSSI